MTNILKYENPEVIQKYGKNWQGFSNVINDELQRIQKAIWKLHDINNITSMSDDIINYEMDANDIPVITDTIGAKKSARRKYVTNFKRKGNPDTYLDLAESIVGIRGIIYYGNNISGNLWDIATWPETGGVNDLSKRWPSEKPFLEVWINVKTNDPVLLQRILDIYRSRNYRPALVQIYLTDDTFAILGVVNE